VKNIIIIAKQWYHSGNVCHSVQVFNGKQNVGRIPLEYGYGDHFLHAAHDLLQAKQVFTGNFSQFREDIRLHKDRYRIVCSEVTEKEDL
jgi:hypothetical protein